MPVSALRKRYQELFGIEIRNGNPKWLRRRIAWQMQALCEGGLSNRAIERATELIQSHDLRLQSIPSTARPAESNASGLAAATLRAVFHDGGTPVLKEKPAHAKPRQRRRKRPPLRLVATQHSTGPAPRGILNPVEVLRESTPGGEVLRLDATGLGPATEIPRVRCAIYTRKSTDENLEQDFNSLDAQWESAQAYVMSQRSNGWVCLEARYDDAGYTGGNTDRPAFQRLMADVESGKVDCILVYKVDRLSRSLTDFARIMETLDRKNVSFVSVTQHFNTTNSMGRLTLNILFSFAQFEREVISERTRDKMAAARKRGKWTGGAQLLGYDIVRQPSGSRLVINSHEAERVCDIFRLYLAEGSLQSTIRALRRRGWRTKQYHSQSGQLRGGADFGKASLQKLLGNVIYLGKTKLEDQIYDGEHEPIVSEELFEEVQTLLQRNYGSGGKCVRNKHGALLKGIVTCKGCGRIMNHEFTRRGSKLYRYYVCPTARQTKRSECRASPLPAEQLEGFVLKHIRALGDEATPLGVRMRDLQQHLTHVVTALKNRRRDLRRRISHLCRELDELRPRTTMDDEAARTAAQLHQSVQNMQDEVARLNKQMADTRRQVRELAPGEHGFDAIWKAFSHSQRTSFLQLLVKQVEYDAEGEAISIRFQTVGIGRAGEQAVEATRC